MYYIEERVNCVVKQEYTYARRALGTIHSERWKQRFACKSKEPLEEIMQQLDSNKFRITSNMSTDI